MSILKKQGVAVLLTIVMVAAAVIIGRAKVSSDSVPEPDSSNISQSVTQDNAARDVQTVYDEAGVLSRSVESQIEDINSSLLNSCGVMVAVVTVNENSDNLGQFALDYAENIGLGEYDFIVVLDISGDNYWLVQGAGLETMFTDQDCSDYAYDYLEADFADGDYGDAALRLTQALADWYADNY